MKYECKRGQVLRVTPTHGFNLYVHVIACKGQQKDQDPGASVKL